MRGVKWRKIIKRVALIINWNGNANDHHHDGVVWLLVVAVDDG